MIRFPYACQNSKDHQRTCMNQKDYLVQTYWVDALLPQWGCCHCVSVFSSVSNLVDQCVPIVIYLWSAICTLVSTLITQTGVVGVKTLSCEEVAEGRGFWVKFRDKTYRGLVAGIFLFWFLLPDYHQLLQNYGGLKPKTYVSESSDWWILQLATPLARLSVWHIHTPLSHLQPLRGWDDCIRQSIKTKC